MESTCPFEILKLERSTVTEEEIHNSFSILYEGYSRRNNCIYTQDLLKKLCEAKDDAIVILRNREHLEEYCEEFEREMEREIRINHEFQKTLSTRMESIVSSAKTKHHSSSQKPIHSNPEFAANFRIFVRIKSELQVAEWEKNDALKQLKEYKRANSDLVADRDQLARDNIGMLTSGDEWYRQELEKTKKQLKDIEKIMETTDSAILKSTAVVCDIEQRISRIDRERSNNMIVHAYKMIKQQSPAAEPCKESIEIIRKLSEEKTQAEGKVKQLEQHIKHTNHFIEKLRKENADAQQEIETLRSEKQKGNNKRQFDQI